MRLGVDAQRGYHIGRRDRRRAVTYAVRHAADDSGGPLRIPALARRDRHRYDPQTPERLARTAPGGDELPPPAVDRPGHEVLLPREHPFAGDVFKRLNGLDAGRQQNSYHSTTRASGSTSRQAGVTGPVT